MLWQVLFCLFDFCFSLRNVTCKTFSSVFLNCNFFDAKAAGRPRAHLSTENQVFFFKVSDWEWIEAESWLVTWLSESFARSNVRALPRNMFLNNYSIFHLFVHNVLFLCSLQWFGWEGKTILLLKLYQDVSFLFLSVFIFLFPYNFLPFSLF